MYELFDSLHYLCSPSSHAKNKLLEVNTYRFKIIDSQCFTLVHSNSIEEYHKVREPLEKKNNDYCIPNQVRLAAIGPTVNESDFYVEYKNILFKFKCILEAFECALQIHILFNIEYQKQSYYFWQFLQFYFYNKQSSLEIGTLKEKEILIYAKDIKEAAEEWIQQ